LSTSFNLYTLETSGVKSVAYNLDQTLIYAARRDGTIDVFDVASHAKVNSWQVGTLLGGMSLSEDGAFLLVAEDGSNGSGTLHRVSTIDGSVQNYSANSAFHDVEIVDAHSAILSGPSMLKFNIDTGSFTPLAGAKSYASDYSVLVEDRHLTLIAEPGISNGPLFVYDDQQGSVAAHGDDYQSPAKAGFNFGSQAISETAGLVAQGIGDTINIYDLSLHIIQTVLFSAAPNVINDRTDGLLFSDDGNYLYARSIATGDLVKYDTHTWSVIDQYAVGSAGYAQASSFPLPFSGDGDQIHISSSGQYFTIADTYSGQLQLLEFGNGIQGTAGPDTLTGSSSSDRLHGNGGDDILAGGTGDDVLDGGDGTDIAVIAATRASTTITINSQDSAVLTGPDGMDTLTSIETIRFSDQDVVVAQLGIFGTAGNDSLTGTAGTDSFYASLGNDAFDGGAGIDSVTYGGQRNSYTVSVLPNGDIRIAGPAKTDILHAIETLHFSDQTVPVSSLVTLGTPGADDLTLTTNNMMLLGLGGNDILRTGSFGGSLAGGAGDDIYYLGTSSAFVEAAGEGYDTIVTSVDLPNFDNRLDNIEALQLAPGANTYTLQAGPNATRLVGNDSQNTLLGGAGDDLIIGALGNDFMNGGNGNDTVVINANRTATTLQASLFVLQIVTAPDGILISNYATPTITAVSADGTDTLASIEKIQFNDVLFDTASLLHTGTINADTIAGTADGEVIFGQEGDDILTGGAGQDILVGGPGRDVFRDSAAGLNGDRIYDLSAGDRITISDASLAGFSFALSGNTLTYTGGTLTLDTLPNGQLYAAAGISGGVDIIVRRLNVQNDFNGDLKSDILWRNADGRVTDWFSTGTSFTDNPAFVRQVGADWRIAGTGDFSGDGKTDLLWRNANGTITFWSATGTSFSDNPAVNRSVPLDWQIAGTGDFNGDGKTDILWRNVNGTVTDWLSTGSNFADNGALNRSMSADWHIAGTGDFTGDGKSDVLWRNDNGAVTVWTSNGTGLSDAGSFSLTLGYDLHIAGTGDFNGDGNTDFLTRNDSGAVSIWQSNGTSFANVGTPHAMSLDWQIAAIGDYSGDGKDDLLWRSATGAGTDWISTGSDFTPNPSAVIGIGLDWTVQQPPKVTETIPFAAADFNGDGKDDLLWRHAGGTVTNWLSNGAGFSDNGSLARFVPLDWRIVGTGDFNGDGKADLLWRNADGTVTDWFSNGAGFSDNGSLARQVSVDWHIETTGDFNGDGRDDILWRNANGTVTDWLSNGTNFSDNGSVFFRQVSADWHIVATGDFNGDGRDDIVWRNADGTVTDWLSNGAGFSDNGSVFFRPVSADWSIAGTGDFNGDGRTDILWRNADGSITDWLSNGSGFSDNAAFFRGVPLDWQIMGVGDFNGDGRDDIEWRASNGIVTDWLSNGSGFTDNPAATRAVPLDWAIQHDGTTLLI
jgi:Ca2+-binding RTX toxin-like protein